MDSCCSVGIARSKQDFIGTLQKFDVTTQVFNGTTKIKQKGTWKFIIVKNHVNTHDILISNT